MAPWACASRQTGAAPTMCGFARCGLDGRGVVEADVAEQVRAKDVEGAVGDGHADVRDPERVTGLDGDEPPSRCPR